MNKDFESYKKDTILHGIVSGEFGVVTCDDYLGLNLRNDFMHIRSNTVVYACIPNIQNIVYNIYYCIP